MILKRKANKTRAEENDGRRTDELTKLNLKSIKLKWKKVMSA